MAEIFGIKAKSQLADMSHQITLKHKILVAGLLCSWVGTNNIDFPVAEEAYKYGFLVEACNLEAFVENADRWKYEVDVLILANTRISQLSTITETQLKTAVTTFMNAGIKVIWLHRQTGVVFEKANGTGGVASSVSVADIFDGLTRTQVNMTTPNGTIAHTADYSFDEEILKSGIQVNNSFLSNFSSTDPSTVFPLLASNGTVTAKLVAYKPGKFFVLDTGLTVSGDAVASAKYKYIYYLPIIKALLGITTNHRLALDCMYGKKIASIGIDADVTTETDTMTTLLDALGANHSIEVGLVSSKVTDDLAKWYKNLNNTWMDSYICSHTGNHFATPTTITDEIHVIDKQIISLNNTCKPIITYIKTTDDVTTFSKVTGADIEYGNPTVGQYCINQSPLDTSSMDGLIKFNASDIGKTIKVTYTTYDEYAEILASLKTLREKGCLDDDIIYLTAGPNSLNPNTMNYAYKNDIVFAEYLVFPQSYRLQMMLRGHRGKMPYINGCTLANAADGSYNGCDDMNLFKKGDKNYLKTTYLLAAFQRSKDLELPYVNYFHDVPLAQSYASSIWVAKTGGGYNADFVKADYPTTRDYVKELYTWYMAQLDAEGVYWMKRGEYSRRYRYMNMHLSYEVKESGGRILLYVKNNGGKPINGLTFRIPKTSTPNNVFEKGDKPISYSYASNLVTLWFDLAAGGKTVIEIN